MVVVIPGRAMKELQYGGALVVQFGAGTGPSDNGKRRKCSDVES
jgi:hypothetical protein